MLNTSNLNFRNISSSSCKKSKNNIIDSFEFHPRRGEREKVILLQTLQDASLGNTVVTSVRDESGLIKGSLGLISLSVGKINLDDKPFPIVMIDYIFVDYRYRNEVYKHLDAKVSTMLLNYAVQTSLEISKMAGVRYLVLRPDGGKENKSLIKFYESMKFKYMTDKHEWMSLKLT